MSINGNNATNATASVTIANSLGIGMTTPDQKLVVQAGNIKLYSVQNVADDYRFIGTEYSSGNGNNKAEIRFAIDGSDTNTRLTFHTAAGGGTCTERMRITSGGTIGIGGITPASQSGGVLVGSTEIAGILRIQGAGGRYFTSGDGVEISKSGMYSYNRGTSAYNNLTINDAFVVTGAGATCFGYTICTPKIAYNGYNGVTAHDLVGHFDAGSTNIATLSGEGAYTRVVAHIEWVTNYSLASTNMTMGYTIVDTRRGNSNTIWVNCACTILAYGDSPTAPTFGWSGGVLSVSVPGSHGLSARFRITTYAATLTPNI
jgi:hypothetical protein